MHAVTEFVARWWAVAVVVVLVVATGGQVIFGFLLGMASWILPVAAVIGLGSLYARWRGRA